ncbi:MAG: hypothetical protein RR537_05545 [Longicatena sp.]
MIIYNGDHVKVNLPLAIVKIGLDMGMEMPQIAANDALKDIDIKMIYQMIENGVIGTIVEVDSAEGDHVEIIVE